MRWRTGLTVLAVGDGSVQVGTDPRWAVQVDGLVPAERDALLQAGPLRTAPRGVAADRWQGLVDDLTAAGLTTPVPVATARPGAADAVLAALADPVDGERRVAARARRCVGVRGLGPVGLTTAVALAGAGVGTVLLADDTPVRAADIGSGYRWSDVGATRRGVAGRVLRDAAPGVRLTAGPDQPDVVVLVRGGAGDPLDAAVLDAAGVAHLSLVAREGDLVVGPFVVGDDGPCVHCLDLHRTDADPAWPVRAGALRAAPAPVEVGVLAGVAGHLAAALVLEHLDTGRARTGCTWEVGAPDALPRLRRWTRHPACGCAAPAPG